MDSIPDELIEKIYQYLRGKDVISFSLTCRRHREILINSYTLDGLVMLNERDYKIFLHSLPLNLFCIDLGYTKITDAGLVHLTKIHTLNLGGTKITDVGMDFLIENGVKLIKLNVNKMKKYV
jgi:hypothetical protein